jgi:hypothetical protein
VFPKHPEKCHKTYTLRRSCIGRQRDDPSPRLEQHDRTATVDPFYLSSEWRAFRQRCRLDSDYYAALRRAEPGEKLILDHVDERRDGGDDFGLTEWLTMSEHNAKTAEARARRAGRR